MSERTRLGDVLERLGRDGNGGGATRAGPRPQGTPSDAQGAPVAAPKEKEGLGYMLGTGCALSALSVFLEKPRPAGP